MKILIALLLWFILLAACWPLAVVLIVLLPVLWLFSIPLRIFGAAIHAVIALVVATILLLPARLLGYSR
jgi:hypothetical protein